VRHQAHSQGPARTLEDHNLPGRIALRSDRGTMGSRWPDRRRELHNLRREGSAPNPGDIVVMDNLGSHKGKVVRALIRWVGAKLFFLPKIFARSEFYRAGLRQAQAPAAQSRCTNRRGRLGRNRSGAHSLHAKRMCQLLRKRWIRLNLNSSRSSYGYVSVGWAA
jgi:hypothetical protein